MATVKLFFLVAGFDYEHGGSRRGLDFNRMCTGRVRERLVFINGHRKKPDAPVTADATLRFLRFDVENGKIEVIDRAFVAGRGVDRETVSESDWKPLSTVGTGDAFDPAVFVTTRPLRAVNAAADYQPGGGTQPNLKQDASTADLMSILDVYHAVHDAPPGSVLEVSFFSHGWVEGPILLNSSDLRRDALLRDTTDKDGRASLDFNATMGEPAPPAPANRRARFLSSFDPKGAVLAWGCNFDIEISLIQQAVRIIARSRTKVQDDTVMQFEFEPKWLPRYPVVDRDHVFFPADQTVTKISRTFGQVLDFLRQRLARGYAFKFSEASPGLIGFGALPGTSGDNEQSRFHMMRVCAQPGTPASPNDKNFECPDGYAAVFRFYKTHLGVQVDKQGYGIFDKPTVDRLNAEIAAP